MENSSPLFILYTFVFSGECFSEAIIKKLKHCSIWIQNSTESHIHLAQVYCCLQFLKIVQLIINCLIKALTGCNAWINECHRMTSLFWKNDAYHPWKGEPFLSPNVVRLRERINQVHKCCTSFRKKVLIKCYLIDYFNTPSHQPCSAIDSTI